MKQSFAIALLLASSAEAIKLIKDKKDGPEIDEVIGNASERTFQKLRHVATQVVKDQNSFQAAHNSAHAAAMAKADKERLAHQTSVWVPRNAVYL